MIHIRNLSVRSKIAIAYLILLILLIGTGLIALFGVNKINRTVIQLVDKLAEEQQVTNKIIALEWENQYFANEYIENNLRLDLAKYTNSMLSLKDILNNYQKLTDDSERIIMIDEIRELQLDYASNFSNINNLNNTKIILNNEVLTIQDTLITSKLARLGENTIFTNNSDKLTLLNSAQYHISLIKSYILQYSTNSDDHWAYSTFDELIILISIFNKMIDLEKNPKQLELAIDTRNTIYLYRDGLFEYKEITDTINNLVNKNINILGPKMRSIANEISSQTKEDFNKAETQTQQNVEKIQIIIIILLVISLMSFYLIVKFLSYSITSPLRELTRVAEKIKSGDLSVRANIHTKNELGLLADTFNSMTITLQDNIDHLENRVSSRTNELIKVNEVLNNQINELNRAENRINELQISLSNIIDSMPSILVSVDKNGYITQWNKTAENITTVSSIEAKGKLISSLLPEMEEQMYKVFESINTGNIINETVEILNTDKSLSYNNIIIYPLIAEVIEGAVIQIYNVTENYKLQDQLAHNNRMDAIGQLAGGIAHDFNNVLGGILNASQLLVMPQRNLDKKSLVCVDLIKKAAVRASDLTSKLL
ncbi:MAG: HAMP domain-containing protein, partial [Spirochaetaceae bacterium]